MLCYNYVMLYLVLTLTIVKIDLIDSFNRILVKDISYPMFSFKKFEKTDYESVNKTAI